MNDTNNSIFQFTKNNNLDINTHNCTCELTNMILKAFTNISPEIAEFILQNKEGPLHDIDALDRYGRNIVHYLIIFYNHNKTMQETLHLLISNKTKYDIHKLLNIKDKLGNTPRDYAKMFNNDYIIYLLEKIDNYTPSIYHLAVKPSYDSVRNENTIDTSNFFDSDFDYKDDNDNNGDNNNGDNNDELNSALEKIVFINSHPSESDTLQKDSLKDLLLSANNELTNNEMMNTVDSETIAAHIIKKLQNNNEDVTSVLIYSEEQPNTNVDIKEDTRLPSFEQVVGPRVPAPPVVFNYQPNTEQMIDNIRYPRITDLFGGKKKNKTKTKGKRKVNTYSEMSFGDPIHTTEDFINANGVITSELFKDKKSSSSSSEEPELASALSEMARNIARQSTVIHERCIEKIAELLKLDLKQPDENKQARYYKAALWREVSKEHPELSNYDRSVEMEKRITKDNLKKIDIEQVTSEIEAYLSDKTKSETTEEKPKKKASKKVEETTEEKPKKKASKKEEKPKKKASKKLEDKSNNTLSISTESSISFESSFSY